MANYPARSSGDQTINYLRAPFTFAVGNTGIVQVGTIPAGCVVLRAYVVVQTVFNPGTTNTMKIGTIASDVAYGSSLSLAAVGVIAGTLAATTAAIAPTVDTAVIATSTMTGSVATAGSAFVVVEFCPIA